MITQFDPKSPPRCKNCGKNAFIVIANDFYCGNCAMKIQKLYENREKAFIMEGLKDGFNK